MKKNMKNQIWWIRPRKTLGLTLVILILVVFALLLLVEAKRPPKPPPEPEYSIYHFYGFNEPIGPVDIHGMVDSSKILVVTDNVNDNRFAKENRRFHIYIGDHPEDSDHTDFKVPEENGQEIMSGGYIKRLLRTNHRKNGMMYLFCVAKETGQGSYDPIYCAEGSTADGTVVATFYRASNTWHIEFNNARWYYQEPAPYPAEPNTEELGTVSFEFWLHKEYPER